MNIIFLLILIAEAVLLFRLEKKMWCTHYTPLNFLMLPYVAVLGITLLFSGRMGLEEFYYPSLIPWIIGLPLFAMPGWLFFLAERRCATSQPRHTISIQTSYRFEIGIAIAIILALGIRLIVFLMQGKGPIGNEEFGVLFAEKGWAGHLQLISIALLMLLLFEDHRCWSTWLVSVFILFFLFVYQVKTWIVLPLFAVFFALIMTQRIRFNLLHLIYVGVGATLVFFVSYLMIYISGNSFFPESTTMGTQLQSITGLFVHYITSGTLGLSADMQQGILEEPNLQHIFTPFYNLWYAITGQPIISGINEEFLYTGIAHTNVRTFFGTLFVFTRPAGFVACCLLFGTGCQFFFGLFRRYRDMCTTLLYAWTCTILFMGWFESLFCLLAVFAIPFWIMAIIHIQRFIKFKR